MKPLLLTLVPLLAAAQTPLDDTFDRMYRYDFTNALRIVDSYTKAHPADPLGHTVKASAHLFQELGRLRILESEFFKDDDRIADKRKLQPDPAVRVDLFRSLDTAREIGRNQIAAKPDDANALFALCLAAGVHTDYLALVEKRQLSSLSFAKESQSWAVKLLSIRPDFHDAHLTKGVSEYLLGSVPFFVRWFVKFEQAEGSKTAAIANLQQVAQSGRYLKPFAKVLLAIVYLREKRPAEAERLLGELAAAYPENPLFRRELEKLRKR